MFGVRNALPVVTLAVGIAATVTVFSWIDALYFNPLPGVHDPKGLAIIEAVLPTGSFNTSSYVEYEAYRREARTLQSIAASHANSMYLGEGDAAARIWGEAVSANYFDLLGVKPRAGRFFGPDEQSTNKGAHPVVVLSERVWKTAFAADPSILGRSVRLNRRELTVIGIAPAEFRGSVSGLTFDAWVPLTQTVDLALMNDRAFLYRGARGWNLFARPQPGATVRQVEAELGAIARRLDDVSPPTARGIGVTANTIDGVHYGAGALLRDSVVVLMGLAIVVLAIACANVANLLLARAIGRRREFGVRLALGASNATLFRSLLREALALAAAGTVLGIFLYLWSANALAWLVPRVGLAIGGSAAVNWRVAAFTVAACLFATLAAGAAPALFASRSEIAEALKEGGRSNTGGSHVQRLRFAIVASEVALATVALAGAGLFIRTFDRLKTIDPGFDTANVLLLQLFPSGSGYTRDQVEQFCSRLSDAARQQAGVQAAAYADSIPLGIGAHPNHEMTIEGYAPPPGKNLNLERATVSPGYFDLMRIPLVAGRDFTDADNRQSQRVAIVNETFARRYFSGSNPIGRKFEIETFPFTIVGIVKDSKIHTPSESARPYFYVPFRQWWNVGLGVNLLVRTAGDPAAAVPAIRREIMRLDPAGVAFHPAPLSEYTDVSLLPQRVAATLMAVLGCVSLFLTAVGLYGVMSYAVSQRKHEIGIRIAIGANPGGIAAMVVRQALVIAVVGLGAGLAGAFVFTRVIESMLYGVDAGDPVTLGAVVAFVGTISVVAAYLPARRAATVDPVAALRND